MSPPPARPNPILDAVSSPWGFALVLGGLSLAFHRDLLPRIASAIPSDLGDPLLNTWILWWNTQAIPFTDAYWNAPIFAPAPYGFALSETLLGLVWLTTPLQWLGASPLVAYNVLVLVTPVLNGLSMYWLCLTLTGRRDAAVVGGLAYAFAPYHASQIAHVQTQAMFWMPVALVGLHRYWDTGRRLWLVCLAAATALNGLACGYFLLYFAVLLGLAILWLTIASGTVRKVLGVGAALAAAALVLAPLIVTYRQVRQAWNLRRPLFEIESFGADLLLLAAGHERLRLWPLSNVDWDLPGREYPQYPGIVITLLLVAGAIAVLMRRRAFVRAEVRLQPDTTTPPDAPNVEEAAPVRIGSVAGLYATGALLAVVLALGPTARIAGEPVWRPAPFAWLMALPGFDATRVPALFGAIAALCLAVLAARAVVRLAPRPTRATAAFVMAIGTAIVADGWAVVPVVDGPPSIRVPLTGDLVVELPRRDHFDDVAAMYRGMSHGRPVVNGYSGYVPPHWGWLVYDLDVGCYESLDALRRGRALDVVIWIGTEEARRIDASLQQRWGRAARAEFAGTIVYHVARAPGAPPAGTVDAHIDLTPYCTDRRPRGPDPQLPL